MVISNELWVLKHRIIKSCYWRLNILIRRAVIWPPLSKWCMEGPALKKKNLRRIFSPILCHPLLPHKLQSYTPLLHRAALLRNARRPSSLDCDTKNVNVRGYVCYRDEDRKNAFTFLRVRVARDSGAHSRSKRSSSDTVVDTRRGRVRRVLARSRSRWTVQLRAIRPRSVERFSLA